MTDLRAQSRAEAPLMSRVDIAPGARTRPRLRLPFLIGYLLALLALQSALLAGLLKGALGALVFLCLHFGSCAAAAALGAVWTHPAGNRDLRGAVLQGAAWTVIAGPFGPVVAGALLVPQRAGAIGPEAPAADVLSRPERVHGALLDRRLRLAGAHRSPALLDVLLVGSQLEKFDALRLISKRYDPAMAPVLRRALADRDGSVRVLAATVMAQQQNRFTKRIGALQSAARSRPDSAQDWCALGRAQLEYAQSGLLERSRAESERREAIACAARAAELAPRDAEIQAWLEALQGAPDHAS